MKTVFKIKAIVLLLCTIAFSFNLYSQNNPDINFKDAKQNFGFVREGELVTLTFEGKNTGDLPLIINDYKVACTCTKAEFPKNPIKPGETFKIIVTFDTKGKLDRQDRTVQLFSNAKNNPTEIRFKGVVLKKKG